MDPKRFSIAFYNLENLFHPELPSKNKDRAFHPGGSRSWDAKKYQTKLSNLSKVIARISKKETSRPPALIGLCEVQHQCCLEDLVCAKGLEGYNYGFTFHQSPDDRGLNNALLFDKALFHFESSEALAIGPNAVGATTRSLLRVSGRIASRDLVIFVAHFPSFLNNNANKKALRQKSFALLEAELDGLHLGQTDKEVIIMGDFNLDPEAEEMQQMGERLFNPFAQMSTALKGSSKWKGKWRMTDQILYRSAGPGSLMDKALKADVFAEKDMYLSKGKFQGTPKRTFLGRHHLNGFSDHFPVYVVFEPPTT